MSKIVKVNNGNYKISVKDGNHIFLDVGSRAFNGTVYISGNLVVEGTQTTVQSETMTVRDNIIQLNVESDSNHNGVTLGKSGLEINRGNYVNAQFLFDESVKSKNTSGNDTYGHFVIRNVNSSNNLLALRTSAINSNGGNLYIDIKDDSNGSSGVMKITGASTNTSNANDYERRVFNYSQYVVNAGPLTLSGKDPNAIPNAQSLVDYVNSSFLYNSAKAIADFDTSVTVTDFDSSGSPSIITIKVDNNLKAFVDGTGFTIDNVKTYANNITSLNNTNLVLSAVTSTIQISGRELLNNQVTTPTPDATGTYLYAKEAIGAGKSGLYIVNTTTSDELVSKNRAILFSMIF